MTSSASGESWRGKVGQLDREELGAFLGEGRIARLACLDDQGWPYVVPCWHEWDGEGFWVIPRKKSAWAVYLRQEPRCAITVDEDGTLRKVIAQCTAKVVEEPNVGGRWVPIAERIAISRCRAVARASSRLATLAQAISSTNPTAPIST